MKSLIILVLIIATICLIIIGEIKAWPGSYRERHNHFKKIFDEITPENVRKFIKEMGKNK